MNYQQIVEWLSASTRRRIYVALGLASLVLTALLAAWGVSPYEVPWWIQSGLTGLGVLAGPFGVIAASNVSKPVDFGIDEPEIPDGEGGDY